MAIFIAERGKDKDKDQDKEQEKQKYQYRKRTNHLSEGRIIPGDGRIISLKVELFLATDESSLRRSNYSWLRTNNRRCFTCEKTYLYVKKISPLWISIRPFLF
ncbi:hypothetical protein ACFCVU_11695 [Peribacillus butanolivorans]|uniref:hypothetical protein n=1 Tax=Peribacillus butanolivorans TaxID=421767 RepID=UPI0035D80FF3